ncbi:hypothetical protein D9M68_821710 [compost metagenome]
MGAGHGQVIAEDHPIETQLATQDVLQPTPRETGGPSIDLRINHMRRHHCRQLRTQAREGLQIAGANLLQAALILRDRHMGIRLGPAMTGKMLTGGCHARGIHAADEGAGQLCGALRIAIESPTADHRTALVIQVQHRSETQVQSHRQHFSGHQPATVFGQRFGIGVVGDRAHRR